MLFGVLAFQANVWMGDTWQAHAQSVKAVNKVNHQIKQAIISKDVAEQFGSIV